MSGSATHTHVRMVPKLNLSGLAGPSHMTCIVVNLSESYLVKEINKLASREG